MEVRFLKDPGEFADTIASFLAGDPFTTSVLGTTLSLVISGEIVLDGDNLWIAAFGEDGALAGAAMQTPPFNVFMPRLPGGVSSAVAAALAEMRRRIPGVNGETGSVREFLAAWRELTGEDSVLKRAQRMYRLGQLSPPANVPGSARLAAAGDIDLVHEWSVAFAAEAGATHMPDLRADAVRKVSTGRIWLWTDESGLPVSLAGVSRPACGVARVAPVFTPAASRSHGYGSAVTARASKAAFEEGAEHVVLYTDLANPVSNSIYQRIGYVADHDAEEHRVVAALS